METSLSSQANNWREARRFRAWELYQRHWKQKDIADALGVTKGAVSQWLKRAKEGGAEALRHRKPPGASCRLAPEQRAQLPQILVQGAQSFGFQGNLWTLPRVAEVIRREFGVTYHPSQVSRILKICGWSRQKPERRATQRNEAAILRWKEERWPLLKKRPSKSSAPLPGWTNRGSTCCLE